MLFLLFKLLALVNFKLVRTDLLVDLSQSQRKALVKLWGHCRAFDLVTPLTLFVKFKFHLLKKLVRSIVIMLLCSVNLNDF